MVLLVVLVELVELVGQQAFLVLQLHIPLAVKVEISQEVVRLREPQTQVMVVLVVMVEVQQVQQAAQVSL
jgi:hypothetical protein